MQRLIIASLIANECSEYFFNCCRKGSLCLFKNLLFTNGMEFKDGTLSRELDFKCDNCNEPLEMDIIESKYFRFIKEARG